MTEDDIRKIAQEVYDKNQKENQFRQSPIAFHKHTGTDSPQVDGNSLNFATGYMILPTLTTVPTDKVNAIAIVNGKLYVFNGTSWVVAGTQT